MWFKLQERKSLIPYSLALYIVLLQCRVLCYIGHYGKLCIGRCIGYYSRLCTGRCIGYYSRRYTRRCIRYCRRYWASICRKRYGILDERVLSARIKAARQPNISTPTTVKKDICLSFNAWLRIHKVVWRHRVDVLLFHRRSRHLLTLSNGGR